MQMQMHACAVKKSSAHTLRPRKRLKALYDFTVPSISGSDASDEGVAVWDPVRWNHCRLLHRHVSPYFKCEKLQ